MELHKRKKTRLEGYDYSSHGAYFVTICVKYRRELLGEIIVGDDAHIVPHIELSQYEWKSFKTLVTKEIGFSLWQEDCFYQK
ncbi:MAG: hypothetical protein RSA20_03430 [Oscillospiraceae bacterium]